MPNMTENDLSQLTNWQLMELLVPDIMERINEADPELLKMIEYRQKIEPGFRPFAHFGRGFL